MKKKVLILAGLLPCLMMGFSVQAGDDGALLDDSDKETRVHHHYHTTVNVHPPTPLPKNGCYRKDGVWHCVSNQTNDQPILPK